MSGVAVTISGNNAQAIAALNGVANKAESVAERIRNGFQQRIGQRMFDGLARAAAALPGAMKDAIDAGGRLSDQMARTGAANPLFPALRSGPNAVSMAARQKQIPSSRRRVPMAFHPLRIQL
jgi:hypothetical protein